MYAENFSQVGANIQKQLDKKGLTQQNLADSLGVSKQVMNKIIKGYKAINVRELSQIAYLVGLSTDELLTIETEPVRFESLCFMGGVTGKDTLDKINIIREAIDEIHMLEGLLDD